MKHLVLIFIVLTVVTLHVQGLSSDDSVSSGSIPADNSVPIFAIDGSIAPYVDKDGYANPIISLGEIGFGGDLVLPLSINFSSAVRLPSPEFGQGWACPLFDSKIVDVQKNLKRVTLLGGKDIYLIYNPRDDTWSHYYDSNWTGKAEGDDFELKYVNGCQFHFHKGRILSLTTAAGRTVVWNRTGDKLDSLQEPNKPLALEIKRDGFGFAKQILLHPDALGKTPLTYNLKADLVYAAISEIACPGGRVMTLCQKLDPAGNHTLTWGDKNLLPMTLTWNSSTGKMLSDDRYNYTITEVSPDCTWPRMTRKNKSNDHVESYYFDQMRGITDEVLPDGTSRHIEMVQAPGSNYKMVRLIRDTNNGVSRIIVRRAFDDEGRLLQEDMELIPGKMQVKQYAYDAEGRLTSYFFNGKELVRNVYDDVTGQVKERILPQLKVDLSFTSLPNGTIRETTRRPGESVAAIQTLDQNKWSHLQANFTSIP